MSDVIITVEGSTLSSNLLARISNRPNKEDRRFVDGLESLLLALHCAGIIDATSHAVAEAVETTLDAYANNCC